MASKTALDGEEKDAVDIRDEKVRARGRRARPAAFAPHLRGRSPPRRAALPALAPARACATLVRRCQPRRRARCCFPSGCARRALELPPWRTSCTFCVPGFVDARRATSGHARVTQHLAVLGYKQELKRQMTYYGSVGTTLGCSQVRHRCRGA
jgi:hypothetical protein